MNKAENKLAALFRYKQELEAEETLLKEWNAKKRQLTKDCYNQGLKVRKMYENLKEMIR